MSKMKVYWFHLVFYLCYYPQRKMNQSFHPSTFTKRVQNIHHKRLSDIAAKKGNRIVQCKWKNDLRQLDRRGTSTIIISYVWRYSYKKIQGVFTRMVSGSFDYIRKNFWRCGIAEWQAYQWGDTRLACWRIADSPILHTAISNDRLRKQGYVCLSDAYREWNPK